MTAEWTSLSRPSVGVLHDPSHDVWKFKYQPLRPIFDPTSVAVVGATERKGSVGRTVLENLVRNPFGGTVFPVNPKRSNVLGIKAYPNLRALPDGGVDLAVIVTPARMVRGVIKECVECGVRGAIVISAGFKELGKAGAELEQKILDEIRGTGMRIVGPNCLGVMNPITGFNATFASRIARKGNVAFISQSGALCTAILDWSHRQRVGFSSFVSIGSMLDVDWGDLIDYLGNDPNTKSILIYMETVGNARSFLSAAREVALTKPIILLKAGRTKLAAKAAISHTGALAGSDDVHEAAFRRSGVLRVNSISDLFQMAEVLAKQPRPKGPRLVIVTNAGGPGVLATDALIKTGGELAEISAETMKGLNEFLPPHWSRNNPIDILGDADHERYSKALDLALSDPAIDGALVILTPQAMTDSVGTARDLASYAGKNRKPILASWMGGPEVRKGWDILSQAGIPVFHYPDDATRVFCYMWSYSDSLRALYETPVLTYSASGIDAAAGRAAGKIIQGVQKAGRTILTECESKAVLSSYHLPTVETHAAKSESEAVGFAERIGYPVVLKLLSETITHKSDVGGVQLNLRDRASVKRAYRMIQSSVCEKAGDGHFDGVTVQRMVERGGHELIVGSSIDPQFGPIILFGAGGKWVEVFKDRSLALPPLNTTLARRMVERTQVFATLKGIRGEKPVDLSLLDTFLVQFSQLVIEQRWIKEIDINPLLASADGLMALDARIVLHESGMDENALPKPAIRPYPAEYITSLTIKDGTQITVRPIRHEDEPMLVEFHKTLSESTVRQRYFNQIKLDQRTAHDRLIRRCYNDYNREIALVAEYKDPKNGTPHLCAVGRLSRVHGTDDAEFSIIVSDRFQNLGLGTGLMKWLLEIGRKEKLRRVHAIILPENLAMQHVCEKLGFDTRTIQEDRVVVAEAVLRA